LKKNDKTANVRHRVEKFGFVLGRLFLNKKGKAPLPPQQGKGFLCLIVMKATVNEKP